MQKLENIVHTNDRDYHLVKRTDTKAMYQSDDGVIEVFKIEILPEQEIYGTLYPEREKYPSSERFGVSAWCHTSRMDLAELKYQSL